MFEKQGCGGVGGQDLEEYRIVKKLALGVNNCKLMEIRDLQTSNGNVL